MAGYHCWASAVDNIELEVLTTCGFRSIGQAKAENMLFTGQSQLGGEVALSDDGTHHFNVFCNNHPGYAVHAYINPLVDGNDNESPLSPAVVT